MLKFRCDFGFGVFREYFSDFLKDFAGRNTTDLNIWETNNIPEKNKKLKRYVY